MLAIYFFTHGEQEYSYRFEYSSVPDRHIVSLLTDYDAYAKQTKFSQLSFTCEICMSSYKGAGCIRLTCTHVFCRVCLDDFWKVYISEGDITRVGCPDPQCVKERKEATEDEVKRVLAPEVFQRLKFLRDKRAFEASAHRLGLFTNGINLTRFCSCLACVLSHVELSSPSSIRSSRSCEPRMGAIQGLCQLWFRILFLLSARLVSWRQY